MRLFPTESETIVGSARALRVGQTTSHTLVDACLARIDEWEPRVHAWVSIDRDGARQRAHELDREYRDGRWRGPLHGIPLGIKDIIDIAGLPTGAGSQQMAQSRASSDATVVRKLRDAGAILLGKTVTTQFACFDPPPTRNPWNVERTPGGSSSGSAAGVATGMCLGAIGSQTGGSITRPATYCGVAGCKPSYGRVSLAGVVLLAPSFDHPGPIARCVADLAILLDVISGHDPADPHSSTEPVTPMDWFAKTPEIRRPPVLARLGGFFATMATPIMHGALDSALAHFRARGASLVEAPWPPTFADVHRNHRRIFQYELALSHKTRIRQYRDDYLPGLAALVEEGLAISESEYLEAKRHQEATSREVACIFSDAEVAVCPAALGPAPDPSTTGDPGFNSPWSYTGLPTVSLPIALAPDGLPLGIQLVGRRNDERPLFEAALWCEAALRAADSRRA
ncbi:MAG TPA: amidase [Planctomycetaceae bacterium]|nr:amidase [Planctomycetaceae bacterium]